MSNPKIVLVVALVLVLGCFPPLLLVSRRTFLEGTQVSVMFDHERLDVYKLELQFVAWASDLIEEVGSRGRPTVHEACDHLDRAGLSSLFNTAEGNGKRQARLRIRYLDDARGSATECAACLDALVAKHACVADRIAAGKDMLVRIVQMLTRLIQRFSGDDEAREGEASYLPESVPPEKATTDDEDEFEDEDDNKDTSHAP